MMLYHGIGNAVVSLSLDLPSTANCDSLEFQANLLFPQFILSSGELFTQIQILVCEGRMNSEEAGTCQTYNLSASLFRCAPLDQLRGSKKKQSRSKWLVSEKWLRMTVMFSRQLMVDTCEGAKCVPDGPPGSQNIPLSWSISSSPSGVFFLQLAFVVLCCAMNSPTHWIILLNLF